jgi:hypothetical protein
LQILEILHKKARESDGSRVPYSFHFQKKNEENVFDFQLEVVQLIYLNFKKFLNVLFKKVCGIIDYNDELMLPAALIYGSPRDIASSMRISELNSLKIAIKMVKMSCFFK